MDASDTSTGTDSALRNVTLDSLLVGYWERRRRRNQKLGMLSDREQRNYISFKKKNACAVVGSARNLSLFQNEREPPECATLPHNVYVWLKRPKGGKTGSEWTSQDLKRANFYEVVPFQADLLDFTLEIQAASQGKEYRILYCSLKTPHTQTTNQGNTVQFYKCCPT